MVWLQDVAAGSELLISYLGSQPSKDSTGLMRDYGFVLPGNINDSIAFAPAGEEMPTAAAHPTSCSLFCVGCPASDLADSSY
jgi:hypothetical protein